MLLSKIRKQTVLIMYIFLGLFMIGGIYGLFGTGGNVMNSPTKKSKTLDKLAEVDGKPITAEQFDFNYMRAMENYQASGRHFPDNYDMRMLMRAQVLEDMINKELIKREAERLHISVSSSELNTTINRERDQRTGYLQKSEDSSIQGRIKAMLNGQRKNKEFQKQLLQMGMSMPQYKDYVREMLLDQKTQKAIVDSMRRGEEENVMKRADGVLKNLQKGEDFGVVASQYSEDLSSKSAGGDMGWLERGMMEPELENAAFTMQPGQVSSLIKTESGVYIIQVLERKTAEGPEYEAAKPGIVAQIRKAKDDPKAVVSEPEIRKSFEKVHFRAIKFQLQGSREVMGKWLQDQRTKAKVRILDPEVTAFLYTMGYDLRPSEKKPDLNHALELYKAALTYNANNEYLYYKIGSLYEKLADEAAGKTAEDPYANVAGGEVSTAKNKASEKLLKQALENYTEAYNISDNNRRYDINIYLAAARTNLALGKKKEATKFYEESTMFAADNMDNLYAVKKGLVAVNAPKSKIKEVDDMIVELEKAKAEENPQPKNIESQTATGSYEVPAATATAKPAAKTPSAVKPEAKTPATAKPAAAKKPVAKPAAKPVAKPQATAPAKPAVPETKPAPAAPAAPQPEPVK